MKKFIITVLTLAVAGGLAWFLLLFPEQVSQENITKDFETHRAAYKTIATYLRDRNITTEITDIPISGREYKNIKFEDSDEYREFMDACMELMQEDHEAIISRGLTTEFVYESTGGKLRKLYGSVIYNGADKVDGKVTIPLTTDGWHLYIAQK